MNQQEILHKAQVEHATKIMDAVDKKKIIKRGRKPKEGPVMTVEKPQIQTIAKKTVPHNLEYLTGELIKIFTQGSFDIDEENAIVNFRGGKKIHECESLSQPAQILMGCARVYMRESFGNRG